MRLQLCSLLNAEHLSLFLHAVMEAKEISTREPSLGVMELYSVLFELKPFRARRNRIGSAVITRIISFKAGPIQTI